MLDEQLHGGGVNAALAARQERLGQPRDVLAALAQRRNRQRDDIDPIEEVTSQPGQQLLGRDAR